MAVVFFHNALVYTKLSEQVDVLLDPKFILSAARSIMQNGKTEHNLHNAPGGLHSIQLGVLVSRDLIQAGITQRQKQETSPNRS